MLSKLFRRGDTRSNLFKARSLLCEFIVKLCGWWKESVNKLFIIISRNISWLEMAGVREKSNHC